MTDRLTRLRDALTKLPHGGYSLTVRGFACRALRLEPDKLTARELSQLRDLMNDTGLVLRRVRSDAEYIDVWDFQQS